MNDVFSAKLFCFKSDIFKQIELLKGNIWSFLCQNLGYDRDNPITFLLNIEHGAYLIESITYNKEKRDIEYSIKELNPNNDLYCFARRLYEPPDVKEDINLQLKILDKIFELLEYPDLKKNKDKFEKYLHECFKDILHIHWLYEVNGSSEDSITLKNIYSLQDEDDMWLYFEQNNTGFYDEVKDRSLFMFKFHLINQLDERCKRDGLEEQFDNYLKELKGNNNE